MAHLINGIFDSHVLHEAHNVNQPVVEEFALRHLAWVETAGWGAVKQLLVVREQRRRDHVCASGEW